MGYILFMIPIVAIITGYLTSREKIKAGVVKDQLELERLKHENFLIETEKLKVELELRKQKFEDEYK